MQQRTIPKQAEDHAALNEDLISISILNDRNVFDNLPGSNVVVWITLITGYVRNSQPKCIALGKQFHAFIIKYRTSTTPALGMLFVACTRNLAAWNLRPKDFLDTREKDGVRIFIEMLLENDEPNKLRLTTVLSLCSTIQSLDLRVQVMHKQCICFSTTLSMYLMLNIHLLKYLNCMQQLFEDMRRAGFRPNQVPFVGLLAACSHAGMVDRALEYFELMQKEYKIKPVMVHYGYLVGMFNWVFMPLNSYSNSSPKILKLMHVAKYVNLCREAGGCFHGDKVGKLKNRGRISIKGEICKLLNDLGDKAKSLGYKLVENMDVIDVRKRKPERTFSSAVYKYEVCSSIWVIEYARWYSYTDHQKYQYVQLSSLTSREIIFIKHRKRLHKLVNGQCLCADSHAVL
uniref:Pentatricopeptide repeat-containing protein n=1 Tax=Salix viminalis TaxID=40686 RepID=A0A6N2MH83_SALVM